MQPYEMYPIKSLVFVDGQHPGVVLGQLSDSVNGDEYNVLYTDKTGAMKEEWVHSKNIKKGHNQRELDCAIKKTFNTYMISQDHIRELEKVIDTRGLTEQQITALWLELKGKRVG